MQEIELKFLVPASRLKGMMRQVKVKAAQSTLMSAHYYDTPKQQLANAGIGLRIRQEGDAWVQTMKAGGDGLAARLEHNETLDEAQVNEMLADNALRPDLKIYKKTAMANALAGFKRKKLAKTLTRQYVTDVERTTRILSDGDSRVEVAYDHGEIIHGQDETKRVAIEEIEFELLSGDVDFLFATAKTWCKRYKLCLSTVTKAERGGLLVQDMTHSQAVAAHGDQLAISADSSQPAFIRALVHNCLLQILPNSSAIVAGSQQLEHVQQLHIGVRRLQAALKAFADFSEQLSTEWLPIVTQTATLLDEYQDVIQLSTHVEPSLEALGAPSVDWQAETDHIKITPLDAVQANDFQLTLLELIAFTMSDAAADTGTTDSAELLAIDKLPTILSKQQDKLLKAILKLTDDTDDVDIEALQKTRRHLENMRYLSEFTAPLYGKKKSKRWLKHLKKAQKRLQEYKDSQEQQQHYAQKASNHTNALYGAGWLQATIAPKQKRCYKQLAALQDCAIFW